MTIAAFVAAAGSGLIAGVFYAFSTFVMRALGRRPAAEGMAAMREINVAVINPMFLGVFLGTAVVCGALVIGGLVEWGSPRAAWPVTGGLLYVFGTFGVTVVFNVPLNEALARDDPGSPGSWADYLRRWTVWNHVRTAAAFGAMILFMAALRR